VHNAGAIPNLKMPGAPTVDVDDSGAPPAGPAGRIQAAPRLEFGPSTFGEIQALLRKRLRIIALICSVSFAAFLPIEYFSYDRMPEFVWFRLVPHMSMLALVAALAVVLWSNRQFSLARLRLMELILFAVLNVGFSWDLYGSLRVWLPIYAARGPVDLVVLATYASFIWSVLIVGYGALIPNTWRRCAAVVGVMALIPIAIGAAAGLTDRAVPGLLLGRFLFHAGFLLTFAVALAVFGSHHIQVLRQQAFEARKLGQYQLKRCLGTGGMGQVYLAEHMLLKRPCAIKVIRPGRAGDPRNLARFEREVQATAALTHSNTVEVFDYGRAADGTFYYVMEYLPGLSLEALVKQHGPVPPARAVHLLRQVCGALQEAHAAGLIHRDIKPGNIIVGPRGGLCDVAKLLDFGLVQGGSLQGDGEKLTQEGAIAGTPAYMSPEQAAGKAELDGRSDIYSLGCVAYFLLTGRPPFVQETAVQTLAAHLGEAVTPLTSHRPDVPADLQDVVLRCLAKEPAQRFQSADELEHALARCDCADAWSREDAAAWWRDHAGSEQQPRQRAECAS
jgi:serine/threonine-protein kinase